MEAFRLLLGLCQGEKKNRRVHYFPIPYGYTQSSLKGSIGFHMIHLLIIKGASSMLWGNEHGTRG
jgi:hypothetical protein